MSLPKEEAILRDVPDPTNLLLARLENWSSTVRNFEDYVEAHIALQKSTTAGLEKARKIAGESPHFEATAGRPGDLSPVSSSVYPSQQASTAPQHGTPPSSIGDALEDLRTKTDVLINKSVETEQSLKQAVLPPLNTIRNDIDKHIKGLKSTGVKQSKEVEKAKSATLQAIESLGTHAASFNIAAGTARHEYRYDPYVLYRQTLHALDDQLAKENAQADALIFTEKNLQSLEAHLIQVLQQATHLFAQSMAAYHSTATEAYLGVAAGFAAVPPETEWNNFYARNIHQLVAYDRPKRQISNIAFNNDTHPATKPVIEGMLSRKEGKLLKSWTPGYYVLTPSHFLLQFASNNYVQDPSPEFALYMRDAVVSDIVAKDSGKYKFTVQGKDGTRTVGLTTKTYSFKANSLSEIEEWHRAFVAATAAGGSAAAGSSRVVSNASTFSGQDAGPVQSQGPAVPVQQVLGDPAQSAEAKERAHLAAQMENARLN